MLLWFLRTNTQLEKKNRSKVDYPSQVSHTKTLLDLSTRLFTEAYDVAFSIYYFDL